jgi:hypothetical protein
MHSDYNHSDNISVSEESGDSRTVTQEYLTQRLEESDISVERGVNLKPGTKRPVRGEKWRNVELPGINNVDSDYGVRTGDGLVVIDVDTWNDMPDPLQGFIKENPTLTIKSPHSEHDRDGHYYYSTESDINRNPPGCDIQGDGSLVADGAEIWGIRDGKDCSEGCCSEENPGVYTKKRDRPIAHVPTDEIESVVPTRDTAPTETNECPDPTTLPDIDEGRVDFAESCLERLQKDAAPFFTDLMDRLNGGRGDLGDSLMKDGEINRSRQDFINLKDLLGMFKHYDLSDDRARELAFTTYTHYCRESPHTKDGQPREWVNRDDKHRARMLDYAVRQYDETIFKKMMNKTSNSGRSGGYAELNYSHIDFAIEWYMEGYNPEDARDIASMFGLVYTQEELESAINNTPMFVGTTPSEQGGQGQKYPSPKWIREFLADLDTRSETTYNTTYQRMRRQGMLKMAYCGGNDHRVYPSDLPDPPDAEYVRCNGEKYDPNRGKATANRGSPKV